MYGKRVMSVITLPQTCQIVEVMFLKCFLMLLNMPTSEMPPMLSAPVFVNFAVLSKLTKTNRSICVKTHVSFGN